MPKVLGPMKFPENHFMQWFYEQTESNLLNMHFHYIADKENPLSDYINENVIKNTWTPESPVFISSQTGSGKNVMIWNNVVENIILKNPQSTGKVLLLCNRVALGRKLKLDAAKLAIKYGNSKYIHDKDLFSERGQDLLCHDFGFVDIYLYQQLLNTDLLETMDYGKYQYIVCDECHFFTSDAGMNLNTDKLLKRIVQHGRKAVRIYMSATLEAAFEPIIREEFEFIEKSRDNLENRENNNYSKSQRGRIRASLGLGVNENAIIASERMNNSIHESLLNKALSNNTLPVHFYYKSRQYKYIEKIKVYDDYDELYHQIKATSAPDNKWIIFVNTKKNGAEIGKELQKENVPNIFFTALSKNAGGEEQEAFEKLYQDERFDQEVLICTSVLDNGISIKDKDVHNIAILEIYDRSEFIQMIGRLRKADVDTKITLHIIKPGEAFLKEKIKDTATDLILRLSIDSKKELEARRFIDAIREKNYDSIIFRNSPQEGWYNSCAIYQLINTLTMLVQVIRAKDPDYYIEFKNPDMEAMRAKLIQDYLKHIGTEKPWARNVFDLLCAKKDDEYRRECQLEDQKGNWPNERYNSTLNKTFSNYYFNDVMERQLVGSLQIKFEQLLNSLDDKTKGHFQFLLESTKQNSKTSISQSINLIYNDPMFKGLPKETQTLFKLYKREATYAEKELRLYKKLTVNTGDPLIEQLKWIQKEEKDCEIIRNPIFDDIKNCDSYDDFIIKRAITQGDLDAAESDKAQKAKNEGDRKYYKRSFLLKHGVPIKQGDPTEAELKISAKYLSGNPFQNELNESHTISEITYKVISCQSTGIKGKRVTCYLFLKQASHEENEAKLDDTGEKTNITKERTVTKNARIDATLEGSFAPISKREICAVLDDVSPTTIEARLHSLLKEGKIQRIGKGRLTQYLWNR